MFNRGQFTEKYSRLKKIKLSKNLVNIASEAFYLAKNPLNLTLYKKLSEFSGGMRTKISFLKLLLSKPDILLLDEPTSNLDSLNEAVILKSLHEERKGKTVILVSHRKSTMSIVDKAYSVEHGRMS